MSTGVDIGSERVEEVTRNAPTGENFNRGLKLEHACPEFWRPVYYKK